MIGRIYEQRKNEHEDLVKTGKEKREEEKRKNYKRQREGWNKKKYRKTKRRGDINE